LVVVGHHDEYVNKTVETFGPITFQYDKSSDPNHCHRPTGSSLGVPSWAESEFNGDNSELKDTVTVTCPSVSPTATATATATSTCSPRPTATPTETPFECPESYTCGECQNYNTHGSMCSRSMNEYCEDNYDCKWGVGTGFTCNCPTVEPSATPIESIEPTATPESGRGGTSDNGGGNPGAPSCNETKPNTPFLSNVVSLGGNSVKVSWQKVLGPVTGYSIYYGPTCGNFIYSVVDAGNVDSYKINGISSGCFEIRALNGCAVSDPSNEVSTYGTGTGGGQVLGASTLGSTGAFMDNFTLVLFTLGSFITGLGIKKVSRKSSN
jgi:hypothetical protein